MKNLARKWQGMNWIRQEKRLAIHLRDGLACAYCSYTVEDGAQLSLDHVRAHRNGGLNHETNLVTACKRCNDSKGDRGLRTFCHVTAAYLDNGTTAAAIEQHVRNCCRRALPLAQAKALIALRGSSKQALRAAS